MTQIKTTDVTELECTDTGPISRTTYRTVAEAKGVDPLDLPPLAETIDAESLEKFLNGSSADVEYSLTFEYAGCRVTVTETEISVQPNDER